MINLSNIASGFPVGFAFPEVYNSAVLEDNLEHTGGLSVSWSSSAATELPVGASLTYGGTKYSLLEPYKPERVSSGLWRYAPLFRHPVARLSRVPFFLTTTETSVVDGEQVQTWKPLPTSLFTGYPQVIAGKLAAFLSEYGEHIDHEFGETFMVGSYEDDGEGGTAYVPGDAWSFSFGTDIEDMSAIVHVNLDGCSIKTAAERIADAIGCNVFFDWHSKTIRFVAGTTIQGEYYNCFHVLGGTTNMSRQTVTGVFAQVYERLTLDAASHPGSIIDARNVGADSIRLTTDLVFDSVYPKLELYVKDRKERLCYATDKDGARIVDHWEKVSGGAVIDTKEASAYSDAATAAADGYTPAFKTYAQWYVQLGLSPATNEIYVFDPSLQIAGTTLGLRFLTDWERSSQLTPLAGRTFDVTAFFAPSDDYGNPEPAETVEHNTTDVGGGVAVPNNAGWFRLINTVEGAEILPSVSVKGMTPAVGDKVSLLNVAVSPSQMAAAQAELLAEARKVIGMMMNRKGEWSETVTGTVSPVGSEAADGYIVTSLRHDIDTDVADVSYGTWNSRRSLSGGLNARIDTVSVSGSGTASGSTSVDLSAFAAENSGIIKKQEGVTAEELETLMQTQEKPDLNERINAIGEIAEEVREQTNREFLIHFGAGTPTPQTSPASAWMTDYEMSRHIYDVYYDMSRQPGSTGGRAWRWLRVQTDASGNVVYSGGKPVESDGTGRYAYLWHEITDADTIASLEKIADVASDGVISAGTEKSRLLIEWKEAVANYIKYYELAGEYGLRVSNEWVSFLGSYYQLAHMLNGFAYVGVDVRDGTELPLWLDDNHFDTDTYLSDYISSVSGATSLADVCNEYRKRWNDWYTSLAGLVNLINLTAKQQIDDIASDGVISAGTEKSRLLIEWKEAVVNYAKYADLSRQYGLSSTDFSTAYTALAAMLNGFAAAGNGITDGTVMPAWLNDNNFNTDTCLKDYKAVLNVSTVDAVCAEYRSRWQNWYTELAGIVDLVNVTAKERTDNIVSDAIIDAGKEKSDLLMEWQRALTDYTKHQQQASDYELHTSGLDTAMNALVAMLNGMEAPEDDDYAAILAGNSLPLWIGEDYGETIRLEGYTYTDGSGHEHNVDAAYYREVWNGFWNADAALQVQISRASAEVAEEAAASAKASADAIAELSVDGILAVDEVDGTNGLRNLFETAYRTREKMVDLATSDTDNKLVYYSLRTALEAYLAAFKEVANYLNKSGGAIEGGGTYPDWPEPAGGTYNVSRPGAQAYNAYYIVVAKSPLGSSDFPTLIQQPDQDVVLQDNWGANGQADHGNTLRDLWAELSARQTALANAMVRATNDTAVEANTTSVKVYIDSVPSGSYTKEGDILMRDGIALVFTHVSGSTYRWKPLNEPITPVTAINNIQSDLAVLWESYVTANGSMKLWIKESAPTASADDFWYDGEALYKRIGVGWQLNSDLGSAEALELLSSLMDVLRDVSFTISSTDSILSGGNEWDVYIHRATFHDSFTGQDIDGELGIWIMGETGWTHVRDNTSGLLENYGDHIVSAVYGDDAVLPQGVNSFAAGMLTAKNALEQFARVVNGGQTLAEALFALGVDVKYYIDVSAGSTVEVVRDEESTYGWKYVGGGAVAEADVAKIYAVAQSSAKLSADKIDFNGRVITFKKDAASTGPYVKIGFGQVNIAPQGSTPNMKETCYLAIGSGTTDNLKIYFDGGSARIVADAIEAKNFVVSVPGSGGWETYEGKTGSFVDGNGNQIVVLNGIIMNGIQES